jgi:hypothetical protein
MMDKRYGADGWKMSGDHNTEFSQDVAQALHYLSEGGVDSSAVVLDAVNVLLDLVKATGSEIEDRRRRALYAIADYCTTKKDITAYLE